MLESDLELAGLHVLIDKLAFLLGRELEAVWALEVLVLIQLERSISLSEGNAAGEIHGQRRVGIVELLHEIAIAVPAASHKEDEDESQDDHQGPETQEVGEREEVRSAAATPRGSPCAGRWA